MAGHDKIIKRTLRIPEHAAGEFRAVLPPELVDSLDFDSLELMQSDLVSQRLDERFNDALFRARFRGVPGYLWLLLEHQSRPDRFIALRVLDYLVRSWMELLRREPGRKSLPPVVCVVIHHGEQGWTAPTKLVDLVEGVREVPALARFVPDFELIVDDLVARSDAELQSRPLGTLPKVVLWVLRDARTIERFYAHLGAWAAELGRLASEAPEDTISVMRYILEVAGDEPFERFKQRVVEAAPAAEATMMTMEQQLLQRGRAEGKAEGKAEAVLAVLAARGLSMNAEQSAFIASCKDATLLDRWLGLAATVSTGDELFSR